MFADISCAEDVVALGSFSSLGDEIIGNMPCSAALTRRAPSRYDTTTQSMWSGTCLPSILCLEAACYRPDGFMPF